MTWVFYFTLYVPRLFQSLQEIGRELKTRYTKLSQGTRWVPAAKQIWSVACKGGRGALCLAFQALSLSRRVHTAVLFHEYFELLPSLASHRQGKHLQWTKYREFLTEIWATFDARNSLGEFPEHFGDSWKELKLGWSWAGTEDRGCQLGPFCHTHKRTCVMHTSAHVCMCSVCRTIRRKAAWLHTT